MRSTLVCIALAAAACTIPGEGARAPGGDPLRGITIKRVDIALSGAPLAQYGVDAPHDLTAMEAAIADALRNLPMQHLGQLSRVARELARTTPDKTNVPSALTDGLMAWAGLPDPHPRFIMIELPDDAAGCHAKPVPDCNDAIASLVEQTEATITEHETLFYGVGVARVGPRATRMVVAVVDRMVELQPLPTAVNRGETVTVEGALVGRRKRPSVEVVDPQGHWEKVQTSLSVDGTFRAAVQCDGAGPYQVEVLADGLHGIEVAANFRLFCGVKSPTRLKVEVERVAPNVDAEQIARANLLYLNEERERQGLAAVAWDPAAAQVALGHSQDMARHDFFGHHSPSTGDVARRFEKARIAHTHIRENLARGYGPKGMHDSLMGSPGHRINILASDVTHVGIGCVEAPPEGTSATAPRAIYCTQNFFKKPGAGAPTERKLVPTMKGRVDEARARTSLPAAQWDRGLDAIAGRAARAVAAGGRMPKGWEQDVFDLGYGTVESHQVRSPDFDALADIELWGQPALAAGIGIARVKDRDGEAFLMIVLVAGE